MMYARAGAAIDLSRCASELDTLHTRADDASDAANQADSSCADYSACHASSGEDCSSERDDCESARESLQSDLDDVDSAIADVQVACGHAFVIDSKKALERQKKVQELLRKQKVPTLPEKQK
jgi:hypothetical protein